MNVTKIHQYTSEEYPDKALQVLEDESGFLYIPKVYEVCFANIPEIECYLETKLSWHSSYESETRTYSKRT